MRVPFKSLRPKFTIFRQFVLSFPLQIRTCFSIIIEQVMNHKKFCVIRSENNKERLFCIYIYSCPQTYARNIYSLTIVNYDIKHNNYLTTPIIIICRSLTPAQSEARLSQAELRLASTTALRGHSWRGEARPVFTDLHFPFQVRIKMHIQIKKNLIKVSQNKQGSSLFNSPNIIQKLKLVSMVLQTKDETLIVKVWNCFGSFARAIN